MDKIKDRLIALRSELGINQKDLAKELGMSTSTYSRFETGEREPLTSHIKKLSAFYNVSCDYILALSDDRTPQHIQIKPKADFSLSELEKQIIIAFREKNDAERAMIAKMLDVPYVSDAQAKKIG